MSKEIWKDVVGYEGIYKVSNLGRVKSISKLKYNGRIYFMTKEIMMCQSNDSSGYKFIALTNNGKMKSKRVHQLVAMAFLDHVPCGFKLVVDHINNIKSDNRLCNLQILTHQANILKYHSNKRRLKENTTQHD